MRIYRTVAHLECAYEEVALIHAQGESNFTNEHQMIEAARKRAGRLGANGVVLERIQEPSSAAKVAGAIFGVETERRGELVAVYVFEPCQPLGITETAGAVPVVEEEVSGL